MTEVEKCQLKHDIRTITDFYKSYEYTKTTEELDELKEAIAAFIRSDYSIGRQHVVEEIADVKVCLTHLITLLNCNDEVEKTMRYKVDRQLKRMEDSNDDKRRAARKRKAEAESENGKNKS